MIKGHVHFTRDISYKIYATPKDDPQLGLLVAHIKLDHLGAEIFVYDRGTVVMSNPDRTLAYDLKTGSAEFK